MASTSSRGSGVGFVVDYCRGEKRQRQLREQLIEWQKIDNEVQGNTLERDKQKAKTDRNQQQLNREIFEGTTRKQLY